MYATHNDGIVYRQKGHIRKVYPTAIPWPNQSSSHMGWNFEDKKYQLAPSAPLETHLGRNDLKSIVSALQDAFVPNRFQIQNAFLYGTRPMKM